MESPGKKRTLLSIKMFIVGLIVFMVMYGFAFDKWKLDPPGKKCGKRDPACEEASVQQKSKKKS